MREKYSISSWFYLFCFLLFLTLTGSSQEVVWSKAGLGANPNLTFLGDGTEEPLIVTSSPFANKIQANGFRTGEKSWDRTFLERVPYSPLPLNEAVIVQGDQGTVWALNNETGDIRWEVRAPEPLDYPIAPPRFRDSAVFTMSRRGLVRKLNELGQVVGSVRIPTSWGRRSAQTVPFRSSRQELAFLDGSGRVTILQPETMSFNSMELWPTREGKVERAFGRTREVLAGALTPNADGAWTVELPGQLSASVLEQSELSWRDRLRSAEDFWSEEGQLISVPTTIRRNEKLVLMLLTRRELRLYDAANGGRLLTFQLPSEAKTPPAYDRKTETWWMLCQEHLVSLAADQKPKVQKLPFVDTPFSLTVLDNFAVIGGQKGHLYGLKL